MYKLRLLAAALAVASVALFPSPAHADGWGGVDCNLAPADPRCTIVVIDTGSAGNDNGGGPLVCRIGGRTVPCYRDGLGWLGADSCYYGKDSGGFTPMFEYIKACPDPTTGIIDFQGTVQIFDPPSTLAAMVQRAVAQLALPRPVIASNPAIGTPQVVYVPVWWWVQPGLWQTHSATASLPGITITARATPTKITWDAGDGTTSRSCDGPGTPWTELAPPTAESPTCGHTYYTTSLTNPAGKFNLRTVVAWSITWSGGGFSGVEPAATTTANAAVEVTELRAVITR